MRCVACNSQIMDKQSDTELCYECQKVVSETLDGYNTPAKEREELLEQWCKQAYLEDNEIGRIMKDGHIKTVGWDEI